MLQSCNVFEFESQPPLATDDQPDQSEAHIVQAVSERRRGVQGWGRWAIMRWGQWKERQRQRRRGHHSPGLISSFLAGGKNVEHFLCVKETVELVPEHPHRTHRVNPSSITSESSVPTMVMFASLDKFWATSEPKSGGASLLD